MPDAIIRSEKLGCEALKLWHGMEDPYSLDWMALWPLIAIAHKRKNFSAAIEHMRALFAPKQHPLPAPLASAVQTAIQAEENHAENTDESIAAALAAAREAQQL